jgi:serine/threonine protein kinase
MMHRDLKSPNVLLSEEGVAKIADVGMVRSQVKDLVTAQPVMTPLWAAPEVRTRTCKHTLVAPEPIVWSPHEEYMQCYGPFSSCFVCSYDQLVTPPEARGCVETCWWLCL